MSLRARLCTAIICIGTIATLASAEVSKGTSLVSQLPPIAHVGSAYGWTIAPDTFDATDGPANLAANGLPDWVQFDAESQTFSGNPTEGDVGGSRVTVTASQQGSDSVSDTFTLLVMQAPAPTLNKPLTEQLTIANSLGEENVLPGDKLHIPLGWSFSVGFQGDTFSLADGNNVYVHASLAEGKPLPSWLIWSSDTYTLYGVAPTNVGPEGPQFDFVLTGSNRPDFGGTTTTLTIVVADDALTLSQPLRPINASVATPVRYTIPTTGLQIDGREASPENTITVSADTSGIPWLEYDNASHVLQGTPPYDQYKEASTTQSVQVPLTFSDTFGSHLSANISINVAPFPFTSQTLPNVFVNPGQAINQSLASLIRSNEQAPASLKARAPQGDAGAGQTTISATFDPVNASSWLHFDPQTLVLSGQVPQGQDLQRVKVLLSSTTSEGQSTTASFYVAQKGDTPPKGNMDDGSSGGLSHRAQVALIASLSSFGGLCALIFLMVCCRRRFAKEEHDTNGVIHDSEALADDERTLTDRQGAAYKWREKRKDVEGTPTTLAASLVNDEGAKERREGLHGVVVDGGKGTEDPKREIDQPQQSRVMANLFGKKRSESKPTELAKQATLNNAGVGLGLTNGDQSDDPYTQPSRVSHSRSRQTVRSSWEEGLFYDDNSGDSGPTEDGRAASITSSDSFKSSRGGLTVADAVAREDDVPRRRGARGSTQNRSSALNFRHRNTHINESPAFHAPGVFTPTEDGSMAEGAFRSRGTSDDEDDESFEDTQTGLSQTHGADDDVEIMQAKIMQVQKHSPMTTKQASNALSRLPSRRVDPMNASGAFDDADDEPEVSHAAMSGMQQPRSQARSDQRNSTLSTISNNTQLRAIQPHVIYPGEDVPNVTSPNPSFMDGASVTGMDPRETMRAIPRPSTPPQSRAQRSRPTHSAGAGRPNSNGSASSRHLPCPDQPAIPGQHLRFHMYPSQPPPMAGPPGSPGKRSGDVLRYSLAIDDALLPEFHLRWPDMMADWLMFDESTFEVSGWVPDEIASMGNIVIALVSSKRSRVPPSPGIGSPNKRASQHSRRGSADSNATAVNPSGEDDFTVCAKARLVFASPTGFAHAL